jgi:hypothetical protein
MILSEGILVTVATIKSPILNVIGKVLHSNLPSELVLEFIVPHSYPILTTGESTK